MIYAFENIYLEKGKADKSIKILEKLRTFTDDKKMQRLADNMIVHVKSLEQAYMRSILAIDNVCSKIKTLADEVAAFE